MRILSGRLAATLLASATISPAIAADPVVSIDSGKLRGAIATHGNVFKDIPFAIPPVGPLRWTSPSPPAKWRGLRDAGSFGPRCIQAVGMTRGTDPQSEDCLYLNVWTPRAANKAPVMVWIYGGAYLTGEGSDPMFDGAAFARDGIALVTFNEDGCSGLARRGGMATLYGG
jgi:para-nitrobenzyl esterase